MKPTKEQFERALTSASQMHVSGQDPECMAQSLLYLNQRVRILEQVFDAANAYMRFGQDEREHAVLLKALEAAREQEEAEVKLETQDFGL